jgi:hypothetical protein
LLSTVKLGNKELGYNKLPVITNKFGWTQAVHYNRV